MTDYDPRENQTKSVHCCTKQVQTEVNLPCTCLESFGSPAIPNSSFLYPYPDLPSFAEKKDKLYQHTTKQNHLFYLSTFHQGAKKPMSDGLGLVSFAFGQADSVLSLPKGKRSFLGNIFEEIQISKEM